MKYFLVQQRKLWGDHGLPLISGYADREAPDAPFTLRRTGPFLPPISFPWILTSCGIVSDDFKKVLSDDAPDSLAFRPAIYREIVDQPWHLWDLDAPDPEFYPEGGEPEGYFLLPRLRREAIRNMPKAWELVLPYSPLDVQQIRQDCPPYAWEYFADFGTSEFPKRFSPNRFVMEMIADEDAHHFLMDNVGRWIKTTEIQTSNPG